MSILATGGLGLPVVGCFNQSAVPVDPQTLTPFAVYDADTVTLSGSDVTAWPDKTGTTENDLATTGDDPTYTAENAEANDHPTVDCTPTSFLQNATASRWKFLHDGSDWVAWFVVKVDVGLVYHLPWQTNGNDEANIGTNVRVNGSGRLEVLYCNAGANPVDLASPTTFVNSRTRPFLVDETFQVWIVQHVEGRGLCVHVNGRQEWSDSPLSTYSSANPTEALKACGLTGSIAEMGILKARITSNRRRGIEDFLATKYAITFPSRTHDTIWWCGNSLTDNGQHFPWFVRDMLDDDNVGQIILGITGQQTHEMVTRETARVDAWRDTEARRNIAVGWEAINHIYVGEVSKEVAMASMQQWAADRRAAGFKTVILSMLPHGFIDDDTVRHWWNDQLVAGEGDWFDVLAPVHTDPDVGQDGQCNDATYYSGGLIHLTPEGEDKILPYVVTAINTARAL